jgi:crotonobetainyl-CoA:carnitine CoA-transferase CaiB-like acyl-CoA transferase
LERLDLLPLCEMGPGTPQAPVIAFLRGVFRKKPLGHWRAWFEGMDVSFAPVNSMREALDDQSVQARGVVLKDEAGREHIAPVVRFLHEPAVPSLKAPSLDEHRDLVGS